MKFVLVSLAALFLATTVASADPVAVTAATATRQGTEWRFDVSLRHPDTGWDHYADAWQIVGPGGLVLGERPLAHPHVDEQPFTRSLTGVVIPDGADMVSIRARCSVDGWSDAMLTVDLR